jgi:serine/threonine protein phosphatase 1
MATYVIGDIHGRSNLLDQLVGDLPWDIKRDTIIFLGDLIDRGKDGPTVVERVMKLAAANPNLIALRGNHEQMLLDFIDRGDLQWLIPENGGLATLAAYGIKLSEIESPSHILIPRSHIEFMRSMPFYYEDEQAIYVHAGLVPGKHPSETDPKVLLWTRDLEFYQNYFGKLCIFGHTPTSHLPDCGRSRRHGIYIHGSAVGIDTSGSDDSPLSCLKVDTFTLYQAYPSGVTIVERLAEKKPEVAASKATISHN